MEDDFSMDWGVGWFQDDSGTFYLLYAAADLTGGGAQAVIRVTGAAVNIDEASLACHAPPAEQPGQHGPGAVRGLGPWGLSELEC